MRNQNIPKDYGELNFLMNDWCRDIYLLKIAIILYKFVKLFRCSQGSAHLHCDVTIWGSPCGICACRQNRQYFTWHPCGILTWGWLDRDDGWYFQKYQTGCLLLDFFVSLMITLVTTYPRGKSRWRAHSPEDSCRDSCSVLFNPTDSYPIPQG